MSDSNIVVEQDRSVAVLTINRPEVRNALDAQTVEEMARALADLSGRPEVKVLIITGAGNKSFVSGADIGSLKTRTALAALLPGLQELLTRIERWDKPVIAAVNGYALGGGCELALACDIRIAADHAKFGLPELGLGIIPGGGGTQRLSRLVGKGKAKELIFTGDVIDAEEAMRIQLVNRVVPGDQLLAAAKTMAEKIAGKAPIALYMAKKAIDAGAEASLDVGLMIEKWSQAILMGTEDKWEGTSAFLEKRKPEFRGN